MSSTNSDFKKIANQENGNLWYVDYKDTNSFSANTDYSIWGKKGKTIFTNVKTSTGSYVTLVIMFEYGYTGDYITKADLGTMKNHINILRSNRINSITTLKTTANTAASNYSTASNSVNALSNPSSNYDSLIATASTDKATYDKQVTTSKSNLATYDNQISDLETKIVNAQVLKVAAEAAKSTASTNSAAKQTEIDGYTTQKSAKESDRKTNLDTAKSNQTSAKTKFDAAINLLKGVCDTCKTNCDDASKAFNVTPFNADTVNANINKINVQA